MSTKRFKEYKNLSKAEVLVKIREFEAQLFQAKIKMTTGQLGDTASLWRMRKELARLKTLQGQQSQLESAH